MFKPSCIEVRNIGAVTLILSALTLSACGSGDNNTVASIDSRSKLEFPSACLVPIPDPKVQCGTLTVAESRADKNSKLITLPFALLPSQAKNGPIDPVAFFSGGPGVSPLPLLDSLGADGLSQFPLRQNRDLIILTPRGNELTIPLQLKCTEGASNTAGDTDTAYFATEAAASIALIACRDRLQRNSVSVASYTTTATARDMEDFRILLGAKRGFKQWNVLGTSYGSRLAHAYVRDFPSAVRTVVLDGPLPLDVPTFEQVPMLPALDALFDACRADSACVNAFPNLKNRFIASIERLEKTPAVVGNVTVSGGKLLVLLGEIFLKPTFPEYQKIPLFIDLITKNNFEAANSFVPFLDQPFLSSVTIPLGGPYWPVTCSDDLGLPSASSSLPLDGASWPNSIRLIGKSVTSPQKRLCGIWTLGNVPLTTAQLQVSSDVPTLITVGQFDGVTPTSNADRFLSQFTKSKKIVFNGRGHTLVQFDRCMGTIAAAFMDSPTKDLDISCVDPLSSLRFVTE